MIPQTYITLPSPVTLDLRIASGPRPRVVPGGTAADHGEPSWHEFVRFPLVLMLDAPRRTITAHLSPIPRGLQIYGPDDFAVAAGDATEDHAARVLQILGNDPASVLQALIDGGELPPLPPRIPREIPNWRAKAVLSQMGLLERIEAALLVLQEPQRTIVSLAWRGDAKLARRGATVMAMAAELGLNEAELDALFIAAEAIEI